MDGKGSDENLMSGKVGISKREAKMDSGQARLEELGFKQELNRGLTGFTNYAFGFSEIGVLMGITGLYSFGFTYGGPVVIIWGWIIVAAFTTCVALSMAEICSSFPTVGGVYFWSHALGGDYAAVASWITAWFNLMGSFANVASVDMICANLIGVMILLATGTKYPTKEEMLGIFAGVLAIHMIIAILGVKVLKPLEDFSVVWDIVGTIVVISVLLAVAPKLQSASFVFTEFNADLAPGIHSKPYIFMLGLLMAQFTLAGYDSCAHMTEETKGADKWAAVAMVAAVVISAFTGFAYILALTFAIQDPSSLLFLDNETGGYASAQIYFQVFNARYGSSTGATILLAIPTGAAFFSGMSCLSTGSRIMYSFNRDKGLPGHQVFRKVNKKFGTPIFSIIFVTVVAFSFGLLSLVSNIAFLAVTSITIIGLYISYGIPIFLRLTIGKKAFVRGPFHLGPFSDIIGWTAVLWILYITIIFILPTAYPISSDTLNYSPITMAGTLLLAFIGWFAAYSWIPGPFKGPVRTIDESGEALPN